MPFSPPRPSRRSAAGHAAKPPGLNVALALVLVHACAAPGLPLHAQLPPLSRSRVGPQAAAPRLSTDSACWPSVALASSQQCVVQAPPPEPLPTTSLLSSAPPSHARAATPLAQPRWVAALLAGPLDRIIGCWRFSSLALPPLGRCQATPLVSGSRRTTPAA